MTELAFFLSSEELDAPTMVASAAMAEEAGFSLAMVYHLLNGIRHLLWDAGWGFEISEFYASGYTVAVLTVVLVVAIRVTRRTLFRVTPQDLLVLFLAITVPNLSGEAVGRYHLREMVAIMVVLFYAGEFVIAKDPRSRRLVSGAAVVALAIIAARSLAA